MRIALIGDIHGNLPALEAVLNDIEKQKVDQIWHMGDMVGYGAFPDQCVQLIKERADISIAGNYDLKVLKAPRKKDKWRSTKKPEKFHALMYAYDNLSTESRKYIKNLPASHRLIASDKRILLVHGSPESMNEPIWQYTTEQRLCELADLSRADIVLSGHTHQPFCGEASGVQFINSSSVGRSEDGNPEATYAVLTFSHGKVAVRYVRVGYDYQEAAQAIRMSGQPEIFAQMLLTGRRMADLEDVISDEQQEEVIEKTTKDADSDLQDVLKLARECRYNVRHNHHVADLAMQLYDQLGPMLKLDPNHREDLYYAAILHNIGELEGRKGRHKRSLQYIMDSPLLNFNSTRRLLIANIARYHRKSLPSLAHQAYFKLNAEQRNVVNELAAILRIATGLNARMNNRIYKVSCELTNGRLLINCISHGKASTETQGAKERADLLQTHCRIPVSIQWTSTSE